MLKSLSSVLHRIYQLFKPPVREALATNRVNDDFIDIFEGRKPIPDYLKNKMFFRSGLIYMGERWVMIAHSPSDKQTMRTIIAQASTTEPAHIEAQMYFVCDSRHSLKHNLENFMRCVLGIEPF